MSKKEVARCVGAATVVSVAVAVANVIVVGVVLEDQRIRAVGLLKRQLVIASVACWVPSRVFPGQDRKAGRTSLLLSC